MASPLHLVFGIFAIILSATDNPVRASKEEIKVGGTKGWRQPSINDSSMYMYQWAATHRFHIGDSLRFQYKNDSVLVVDRYRYFHCNTTNPISTFKGGSTVVTLERPGPAYFISGDPSHCKNGQRLVIEVMGMHSTAASPPLIANPPQSYMAVSPSPVSSSGESVHMMAAMAVVSAVSMGLVTSFVTHLMFSPYHFI